MYSVEPATRPAAEMVTIVRPFPSTAEAEEEADAEEDTEAEEDAEAEEDTEAEAPREAPDAEFEEAEASVSGASEAEAEAASAEGAGAPPDGCPGGFGPVEPRKVACSARWIALSLLLGGEKTKGKVAPMATPSTAATSMAIGIFSLSRNLPAPSRKPDHTVSAKTTRVSNPTPAPSSRRFASYVRGRDPTIADAAEKTIAVRFLAVRSGCSPSATTAIPPTKLKAATARKMRRASLPLDQPHNFPPKRLPTSKNNRVTPTIGMRSSTSRIRLATPATTLPSAKALWTLSW